MATIAESFQSMASRIEPDIQATLSDFLTYTEHFPSQITRALALIQSETRRIDQHIASIHADTTAYGQPLPSEISSVAVRKRVSHALEEVGRAGRMRVEEATRLVESAKREQARLGFLVEKLKTIPLPSRDPTPEETVTLTSPNGVRNAKFGEMQRQPDKIIAQLRAQKIMVPGEVMPPLDPNIPTEILSDWTSRESTPVYDEPMRKITPRQRSRTPRPPRFEGEEKRPRPRGPRQPGQPGTNAHSAVAGISTSNALLALNPPPADAQPGSKWLPWMKLTEWEMAKLRKRMKKNAIWVPSATMVRRELKNLGRGIAGRDAARVVAEAQGVALIDEHNDPDPTKLAREKDEPKPVEEPQYVEQDEDADAELENRGMRLNEAKKLKRARMLEEQREAAAQIARELGQDHDTKPTERKRKRESTPVEAVQEQESPDQLSKAAPPPRRIKLSHTPQSDKPASGSKENNDTAARKPTIVLKASKAGSEPPSRRASLRRSSVASLPDNTVRQPRRSKRPVPGVVTSGDNESARVSASRRKAAPRKRGSKAAQETSPEEEVIDPDEPRYCICGDVSWGPMIACDNEASCEKEWFHLSCVGLEDNPPRRTKWYCPDCRKKLKVGQTTNGLVGRVSAAR